ELQPHPVRQYITRRPSGVNLLLDHTLLLSLCPKNRNVKAFVLSGVAKLALERTGAKRFPIEGGREAMVRG
ncbi:MAG: hypothetical protein V3V47_08105, partial [Desulfobacteria bacterium]